MERNRDRETEMHGEIREIDRERPKGERKEAGKEGLVLSEKETENTFSIRHQETAWILANCGVIFCNTAAF